MGALCQKLEEGASSFQFWSDKIDLSWGYIRGFPGKCLVLAYPVKDKPAREVHVYHPALGWQPHHRSSGRFFSTVRATGQSFASSSCFILACLKVFHSFVSYFCYLWAFSVYFITRQWCWVGSVSSVGFSAQLWPFRTSNCDSSFLPTICQGHESFCKANELFQ